MKLDGEIGACAWFLQGQAGCQRGSRLPAVGKP